VSVSGTFTLISSSEARATIDVEVADAVLEADVVGVTIV